MSVTLTRRNWVIGNWKLNPYFEEAKELYKKINDSYVESNVSGECKVAIAPPMPYIGAFLGLNNSIPLVAQDISTVNGKGAFTGEVSADLLKQMNVAFTLIGHSERRELFGDNVQQLTSKIQHAVQSGLTIIYCVGESLAQREAGQVKDIVLQQLQDLSDVISAEHWSNIIVAYEPIWAIGTGKTASPEDAQKVHAMIRQYLSTQTAYFNQISILYGGSVKSENAVQLAACADIDGALVGGASLEMASFMSIVQAFAQK